MKRRSARSFSGLRAARQAAVLLALMAAVACGRREAENRASEVHSITPGATDLASALSAPVGDSGAPKLPFVDQADSSFTRFRRELQMHLQNHDTAYLYAILAPDIKSSFGGDHGIDGFKTVWQMDDPDSSEVWSTLSRALALGGKLERDESNHKTYFIAPYVYADWPQNIDPFENVAVIDADVPVHELPNAAAPAVARVSHSILRIEQGFPHDAI